MGGLAQQAGTLGQEQLLAQTSSEMLRDMQAKVLTFTKGVMTDVAWWMYTDPVGSYDLTKNIEGFGEIPFQYGPENRKAEFFRFNLDVVPYSLQSKGPQERLGQLMELTQNLFLPLAPQMSEWGMTLNLKSLVELIAKYGDIPEISDIISSQIPFENTSVVQDSRSQRPLQSPNTTRNYTRTNISGGPTNNARSAEAVNNLIKVAGAEGRS